ncbi:MAG TPA: DUF4290 domain-containing protein [Chitinophagaceae bacterium]|nr:DUF4290 domain-containing protein [Chitinophagaceae bacterium]
MMYNTQRKLLNMREYGRNVQQMVDYLFTIEDRDKRSQQAKVLVELMAILNPHLKNVEDFRHMLWDHLHFMSNFSLDVDSPFPMPEKETYKAKPAPLPYPKRYPKYSHLGKNLETVINKAMDEPDEEKKAGFAHAIAYYMKLSYSNWHKELVHDDAIRSELDAITGGALEFSNTPYIRHRNQIERDDYRPSGRNGRQNFGGNRNNRNNNGGGNRNGGNNRNGGGGNRPKYGSGPSNGGNRNFGKRNKI